MCCLHLWMYVFTFITIAGLVLLALLRENECTVFDNSFLCSIIYQCNKEITYLLQYYSTGNCHDTPLVNSTEGAQYLAVVWFWTYLRVVCFSSEDPVLARTMIVINGWCREIQQLLVGGGGSRVRRGLSVKETTSKRVRIIISGFIN